ncbi:tRNA pseudouridine(55) synthase TruB, partial [Thermus scotoductus]
TGLLLLVSDESTKLVPFLSGEDKEYIAWVSFGATTPTLDAEGLFPF